MSRYDQKYKPYCPNCRKFRNGNPDRVLGQAQKINKCSVVYACARCNHKWKSRSKFALREIGRRKREKEVIEM